MDDKLISYIKITFELENMYFDNGEFLNVINTKKEKEKNMENIKLQVNRTWEDYFIEGTEVLKNIPDIHNGEELSKYEKLASAKRLVELYKEPMNGDFDFEHLCKIHEYLFQDVYDWAGEIRTVPMMKQTVFLGPEKIKDYVKTILNELNNTLTQVQNEFELADCLSHLFYCLIYAHPFREGNGRTIREFIRQLVNSIDLDFGSYDIDYTKINKEIMAIGIISGAIMFITPEFQRALVNRESEKDINQYVKKIVGKKSN